MALNCRQRAIPPNTPPPPANRGGNVVRFAAPCQTLRKPMGCVLEMRKIKPDAQADCFAIRLFLFTRRNTRFQRHWHSHETKDSDKLLQFICLAWCGAVTCTGLQLTLVLFAAFSFPFLYWLWMFYPTWIWCHCCASICYFPVATSGIAFFRYSTNKLLSNRRSDTYKYGSKSIFLFCTFKPWTLNPEKKFQSPENPHKRVSFVLIGW